MIRYRVFNRNTKAFEKWHTIKQDGNLIEFYKGLRIDLYTHKFDSKGNRIYEGDIVRHILSDRVGLINYRIERARWEFDDGFNQTPLGDFSTEESLEIIGNYHQNNDLVEKMNIYNYVGNYIKDNMNYGKNITLEKTAKSLCLSTDDIEDLENEVFLYFSLEREVKFTNTLEDFIEEIYNAIEE